MNVYSKWRSRRWRVALLWSIFVPIGLVAAPLMARYGIEDFGWLTALIGGSAAIVTAFVGMESYRKTKQEEADGRTGRASTEV